MNSFDVPDSTDWLNTPLSGLMKVEQAFRCHVCKDFYNTPMLTSCSHTFCSLCIRRSLSEDGKCPLCRAADQENKLRGNHALREAVDAFVESRVAVLEVARAPKLPPPAVEHYTPKRKVGNAEDLDDGKSSKRTRTSLRRSKAKGAEATAAIMQQEAAMAEAREQNEHDLDDGLAPCPICWTRMKPEHVYNHIDSCTGIPLPADKSTHSTTEASTKQFTTQPLPVLDRLPPLNYSMLSDQQLKKKLSSLGISATGNRQLLQRRHKEWVTIWNANCDSSRPKKRSELQQDLAVWERTVGAPAPSRAATIGAQIKDKEFDGEAWAAKHQASFKDLISNARKSRKSASQLPAQPATMGETLPVRGAALSYASESPARVVDLMSTPPKQPQLSKEDTVAEAEDYGPGYIQDSLLNEVAPKSPEKT